MPPPLPFVSRVSPWLQLVIVLCVLSGCSPARVTSGGQTDPDTVPLSASVTGRIAVLPGFDPEASAVDGQIAPFVAAGLDSLRAGAGGEPSEVVPLPEEVLDSLYTLASVYPRAPLTGPLRERIRSVTGASYVVYLVVPGMSSWEVRERGDFGYGGMYTAGSAYDGTRATALGVVWDMTTGDVLWSGVAYVEAVGGRGRLEVLGDDPMTTLRPRLARQLAKEIVGV